MADKQRKTRLKADTSQADNRYELLKQERRLVRVVVDLDLIGRMFLSGIRDTYKVEGLPEDAIFIGASNAVEYYGVNFFYAHESFEPVGEGLVVPQMSPSLTRLDSGTDLRAADDN